MSENAIVRQIETLPMRPVVDLEAIEAARAAIVPKEVNDGEFRLFVATCQRLNLDPLRRQIYAAKTGGKLTIMIGIEGFLAVAGRTGLYLGCTEPLYCGEDGAWKDIWTGKDAPVACKVGVFRRGAPQPTYAPIYYHEFFVPTNPNWKTKPLHMMSVRALAHSLKRAFPDDLQDLSLADQAEAEGHTALEVPAARVTEDVPMPKPELVRALQAGEKETYSESKGLPEPQPRSQEQDCKAIVQANLKQLGWSDPKKTLPYLAECLGTRLTSFKDLREEDWPVLAGSTTQAVKDKGACFAIWGKNVGIAGSKETDEERAFRLASWGAHLSEQIQSTKDLTPVKWALLRDALTAEFSDQPEADPFVDE